MKEYKNEIAEILILLETNPNISSISSNTSDDNKKSEKLFSVSGDFDVIIFLILLLIIF